MTEALLWASDDGEQFEFVRQDIQRVMRCAPVAWLHEKVDRASPAAVEAFRDEHRRFVERFDSGRGFFLGERASGNRHQVERMSIAALRGEVFLPPGATDTLRAPLDRIGRLPYDATRMFPGTGSRCDSLSSQPRLSPAAVIPNHQEPPALCGRRSAWPNVVIVITDDQRADQLTRMPFTNTELVGKGVRFDQAFASPLLPLSVADEHPSVASTSPRPASTRTTSGGWAGPSPAG